MSRLLIVGIDSFLGQAVTERLMRENPFDLVLGIGRRPPSALGLVHFISADTATVDLGDLIVMNQIDAVLYLAPVAPRPPERRRQPCALERLLEAAEPAGMRRLVVPSRDRVYAPSATPVSEDAPLRELATVERAARPLLERLLAAEALLAPRLGAETSLEVVIPRLGPVLGRGRGRVLDALLGNDPLLGPPTGDPSLQFLHASDAAESLVRCALEPGLRGPYNVAGREPLSLTEVAGVLQSRLVRVPRWLPTAGMAALARLGVIPFAPTDLLRLSLGVAMNTERAGAQICTPRFSARQALAWWRVGETSPRDPFARRSGPVRSP